MSYLSMLTKDEIKYICSVIPLKESILYFKRNPKDFAKIMPGFRPTSLKNQEQVSMLLYRSRNQFFISLFIEKHISRWLAEIQEAIELKTDKGESKESAWIQTLPFSYFVDNIRIYFKLIGEELPNQYVSLMSSSIKKIKNLDESQQKIEVELLTKKSEVMQLKEEIRRFQFELKGARNTLLERSSEIKSLKRTCANLKKLESVISSREQEIDDLKKKIQMSDENVKKLNEELSATIDARQKLEISIKEKVEQQLAAKHIKNAISLNLRRPRDMEEFRDYLGYNLESMGVATDAGYYFLLKEYLCKILFQGKPVIISRIAGIALMRCVANALVGTKNVATLSFSSDVTQQQIDLFLSNENRIFCLDNFLGNYNETILLTICDKYRDKIIFLTTAYDRTLCYMPEEFWKYCNYLNLNRIEAFTYYNALLEDPSTVDEISISHQIITSDSRWSHLIKEILDEFSMCSALSIYKSSLISDEESLCCLLAFDILPFCVDVLEISPFNISERLNKYAGDKGRCLYKDLFRRWFV